MLKKARERIERIIRLHTVVKTWLLVPAVLFVVVLSGLWGFNFGTLSVEAHKAEIITKHNLEISSLEAKYQNEVIKNEKLQHKLTETSETSAALYRKIDDIQKKVNRLDKAASPK